MTETETRPPQRKSRRRWWVALAVLVLVIVVAVSCNAGGGTTVTTPGADAPAAAPPKVVPVDDPLEDKDWHASDIRTDVTQFGMAVTARVTNGDANTRSGLFTLTMLRDGRTVTTVSGAANDVAPGGTVTVTFVGTTAPEGGVEGLEYQFQSDL